MVRGTLKGGPQTHAVVLFLSLATALDLPPTAVVLTGSRTACSLLLMREEKEMRWPATLTRPVFDVELQEKVS